MNIHRWNIEFNTNITYWKFKKSFVYIFIFFYLFSDILRIQFSRSDPPTNITLKKRTYPTAYPRYGINIQQQRQAFKVNNKIYKQNKWKLKLKTITTLC
jgi:hypothetical protein